MRTRAPAGRLRDGVASGLKSPPSAPRGTRAFMVSKGPLLIRLCNWVGEAVLTLPTLQLLADQGYELHLIGKRWAGSLFSGHGWAVHVRPAGRKEAVAQLKALRHRLEKQAPGFGKRPNILLFTNSISSALEARLAGLRPIGYNREGRSLLLAHGVPDWKAPTHAADEYWRIGTHFLGMTQARPDALGLQPSAQQQDEAFRLMTAHGIHPGFVLLCPFSGADDSAGAKVWPGFVPLAETLAAQGRQVVICPGPGEEARARAGFPHAIVLDAVDLGAYAALSQHAEAVVANDTGPGHLAAAAGARVISVLRPEALPMWHVVGPRSSILHEATGWPPLDRVLQALQGASPA